MSLVTVTLQRDGPSTPWGFRLQGGRDIGTPLSIQRVFLGSPAEGELLCGDTIMRIGQREANKLNHQDAHNYIKSHGNQLSLTVHRGGYRPPGSNVSHQQVHGVAMPERPASPYTNPLQNLPKTDFGEDRRYRPPPPANAPAAQQDSYYDIEREKMAISGQPHRTFPLIQPGVKVRHDVPTGSYLRFTNDPAARIVPPPNVTRQHQLGYQANEALMKARIQESVTSAASNSSSIGSPVRGRSETPDSASLQQFVTNRQYNTPINMYSAQNVRDTIRDQTGVVMTPVPSGLNAKLPRMCQSPTYQTIYEQEWKDLRKDQLQEHKPVPNLVKETPHPLDGMNQLGTPQCRILQSKSFEVITDTLRGETNF